MKIYKILLLAFGLLFTSSCDLDLQESPNALSPEAADPDFILNAMQFGLNEYFFEVTHYTMEVTRMVALEPRGGSYETAYQPQDFDDMWEQAYTGIVSDGNTLIRLAEERGLFVHSGIARVIQAYTLLSLVDFFGNVPWSTALDPSNFTPTIDNGDNLYATAEQLLDAATEDFNKTALGLPANDLFYNGDTGKWKSLAKTLKLKVYLQTRLVSGDASSKIDALIKEGDLISQASGDWEFPFSTDATTVPDSRHPYFSDNYGGASDYMANYFMWLLKTEKAVEDPRLRYYFYRQTLDISSDVNELPCIVENRPNHYAEGMVFCNAGDGWWGRDHLDTDGIPPDNQLRTVFGIYPVGGKFDADEGALATFADGLQGAGVHPLMQASWVKFMEAEAALTLGTSGDPRALLEEGVRMSMDKVLNFAPGLIDPSFAASVDEVEAYATEVLKLYDEAASDADKLDVIMKEYFIALWGNGVEAYNNYRRTGSPRNAQQALSDQPGVFIRSFPYPSNTINRNANVSSKGNVGVPVFWDTNPVDFIR